VGSFVTILEKKLSKPEPAKKKKEVLIVLFVSIFNWDYLEI